MKASARARRATEMPADDPSALPFEPSLRELRASIANLRAVADALDAAVRSRGPRAAELLAAVITEAERASRAVDRLAGIANRVGSGNSAGAETAASRFAAELARRAATELDLPVHLARPIEGRLVAPPALLSSILAVLGRLRRDYGVGEVELSARRHDELLAFELSFAAREPESSRLREAHTAVLAEGEPALGEVARAAGGEAWLAIRRGEARFSLRILLPRSPTR